MTHAKTLLRPETYRNFAVPKVVDLLPPRFVPRHEIAKEILGSEADTQGWSAASAVRLTQVNAALKKDNVYPKTFSHETSPQWFTNGDFGPWTMTRGGSGSIVFLKIPLKSAAMEAFDKKLNLNDGSITIQVKLKYLPQPTDTVDDMGVPNNLVTNANDRAPEDPAVVIQFIDYGTATPAEDMKALFRAIMAAWFNDNIDVFTYIFAVVSLNQVSEAKQFAWLKPTYTGYAYYDGNKDDPNEDQAYFGVLTMTNGKPPTGLANQLPASAIPEGQGAALLIGNELFLENMVLPAVSAAFPGSSPSDFNLTNDNTSIQLLRELELEKVKVGAIWYQPVAQSMILQIVGDEIQTRMKIHTPISPGIDGYVLTETWNRLKLVDKPDGTQTLDWVESREPIKDSFYTKETWVTVTEIIISVIGAVAGGVALKALTGIIRVIVVIIIGIVAGLAAATPTIIAKVISEGAAAALPPINQLLTEFTEPIEWPSTTGFILSMVQLNGSLQLSGNFTVESGGKP